MSVPVNNRAVPPPSRFVEVEAADRTRAGIGGPPVVHVDGIPIHEIDMAGAIDLVMAKLDAGAGGVVVTHNLDHLRRLRQDRGFWQVCDHADLRVADGMPLLWAAALRGTPLPERVAGSSLMPKLSAAAAAEGRSVFLLGGEPGTAEAAAAALVQATPQLQIAGTDCPPHGFESDPGVTAALRRRLAESAPDIVFVALGSPKQELLIDAYRDVLPRAWWLGVGITFSFLSGDVQRAPGWMQSTGLEWAHRLSQEPRRLARRYLIDGVPYAGAMLARAGVERIRPSRRPANARGHSVVDGAADGGTSE